MTSSTEKREQTGTNERRLREEVVRLREALEKYGEHADECNVYHAWGKGPRPCDCGLDAVLNPERGE